MSRKPASRNFPRKRTSSSRLCKALKAKGKPAGFALGKAVGDGNNYAHWLLWSHGGKMVDESGKVVINSPETIEGASTMHANSTRPSFRAPKAGSTSTTTAPSSPARSRVTANGVSLYYAAKNDPEDGGHRQGHPLDKPADRTGRPVGGTAPDDLGGDLQLHEVSRSCAGLSAVHVRQAADGCLDLGLQRLLLPAAEGHSTTRSGRPIR